MLSRPDKDALRAMLESQVQEKLKHDPEAVTTYAAQRDPERKPYTSKPTVQYKAFDKELDQMRADAAAGVIRKLAHVQTDEAPSIEHDEYPGLIAAATAPNEW
ncbi:MAG: hypothetical protein ACRES5_31490 [Pseudomonas sp.]